jgi:CcmD family protein
VWSMLLLAVNVTAFQPGGGQDGFVPANSLPPADQLPAAPLLVAAYAFVWVALMIYLWSIWRRLTRVEEDMRGLQQRRVQRNVTR